MSILRGSNQSFVRSLHLLLNSEHLRFANAFSERMEVRMPTFYDV